MVHGAPIHLRHENGSGFKMVKSVAVIEFARNLAGWRRFENVSRVGAQPKVRGSIYEVNHLVRSLDGESMLSESRSRSNEASHFANTLGMQIRTIREQGDQQVLERDHPSVKLNELSICRQGKSDEIAPRIDDSCAPQNPAPPSLSQIARADSSAKSSPQTRLINGPSFVFVLIGLIL